MECNMNIEIVATSEVKRIISRNHYLKPVINENDNIPVWDGEVFVYRDKSKNQKNKNLIGKAPVQVKGHEVKGKDFNQLDDIKFRVQKSDFVNYYNDGGVIYFVVYINDETEKVFYNSLLPLDLKRLLNQYNDQDSFTIKLRGLPKEELKVADIFFDFIQNKRKQQGTLISNILYSSDIEKEKENINNFKFSYSTLDASQSHPFKELTTRDFYIYAQPAGIGNPIPFEKASNAIISVQEQIEIAVKDKIYYKEAFTRWEKGSAKIICSNSVSFEARENEEFKIDFNINFQNIGTLDETLNDLYFFRALALNKEIRINGQRIPYDSFEFDNINYVEIEKLERIKSMLDNFGVKKDLRLNLLTEEDKDLLTLLLEENISSETHKIDSIRIVQMKVANLKLVVFIEENIDGKYYTIKDFFNHISDSSYISVEDSNKILISQFLILDKVGLSADNLNSENIFKDIVTKFTDDRMLEVINNFLLEAIKAFDVKEDENESELGKLLIMLSSFLYEREEENYSFINLAQVKYRLGSLNQKDIEKLNIIREQCVDVGILAGAAILLGEKEEAEQHILEMASNDKEQFMSYPIYQLL